MPHFSSSCSRYVTSSKYWSGRAVVGRGFPVLTVCSGCGYYERSRTHLSLDKDTPIPRPITKSGDGGIVAIPQVGGLHHRYDRRAA